MTTPEPTAAPTGEHTRTTIRDQRELIFPAVTTYYSEPLVIDRARGVRVWHADGAEYLDLFAGILTTSLGHAHPEVVQRVTRQLERLGHTSSLYVTEPQLAVARRLRELAPEGLARAFFTNSGTEAIETAIMAARQHTGRSEIVALRNGYSGRSHLAASLTGHGGWRPTVGAVPGIVHARAPSRLHCPYRRPCDETCTDRWIDELVEVIETTTNGRPAALLFEPVQGVGGFNVLPDDYMRRAAEVIRAVGGLLIVDEVQTGFGRTGGHWWGIDRAGVTPDILVMAKGIANGLPVGATLATDEIAQSWSVKTISTFGGNPVCMAAADATLEIMVRERVPERAAERGAQLRDGLDRLAEEHAWIGEVRGRGLMQALELVADDDGLTPDPERARRFLEASRREGVLVGLGGLHGNVLRIGPSLLISEAEVAEGLDRLGQACAAVERD